MENSNYIDFLDMYRGLNKFWAQKWNKVSENGHSVTHAMALEFLEEEGRVKASSLANFLSITTGGVTGIVDKLVNEGLVKKARDVKDRRAVYLEITNKGTEMVTILRSQRVNLTKEFLSALSESELQELLRLNKKLINNMT